MKKQPTRTEIVIAGKNNLQMCNLTITHKQGIEQSFIELGAMLREVRNAKRYEGHWESFEDFLGDPKMNLDRGTASKLITICERFIIELKVSPVKLAQIGYSKAYEIARVVESKKDAEEWLHTAAHTSRSDLTALLREKRTGVDPMKCDHPESHAYEVTLAGCRKCGEEWVKSGNK